MLHIFAAILLIFSISTAQAEAHKILITINQFISHPALDQARAGVEEALRERGLYPNKIQIKFDNAYGNIAASAQIAKHQASLQPAFMVAIATPAAQSTLKASVKESIVAFVAVSDPEAAGLDKALYVIGVKDQPPLQELLEEVLKIMPQIKAIGVVFNSGEINSVKLVEQLEKLAATRNIKVEKSPITTSTNIKAAAQKLVGKVDVVYLPLDNTVVSALSSLLQVTTAAGIPIVGNDPSLINEGLLLTLGSDYFKSGLQLGNMIADKIDGKELKANIQIPNVKELKINSAIAEKLKIKMPVELKLEGR